METEFKPIELTPEQEKQWRETMGAMGWRAPGFQSIMYRMLTETHDTQGCKHEALFAEEAEVPIAATDGCNLILNPHRFFKMKLMERVFVLAHEVVHNMYDDVGLLHRCVLSGIVPMHDGTTLPFDNDTMQKAADYRINALLVESKIGTMPTGENAGLYDLAIATANCSILDVYRKVYEKGDACGKGFDKVLPPGKSRGKNPNDAAAQRNDQVWAVEIALAKRLEQECDARGSMPMALARMFEELLSPEVPWQDLVQASMHRTVGSGTYDWTRGDRRYLTRDVYLPSASGYGCGWLVCWGDTSGSRNDKEIGNNVSELAEMVASLRPRRLTMLWGDAEVANVQELADGFDLKDIEPKGGGGTDVAPCFQWIEEQMERPDMFIGFTDGGLCFPPEPPFPVLWVSSTDAKYPYGEVVRVLQRARA